VLDRPVAAVQLDAFLPPAALAARTGVALIDHVRHATASRALTISAALAAVAAARYAAAQAVAFADGFTRAHPIREPWRGAPAAWLAVDIAYAPFDDGTKHSRPDDPVRAGAIRFYSALRDASLAFAAMPPGIALPQQATLLRGLADQLPELAAALIRGTHAWAQTGALLAPERRLRRFEDRDELRGRPDQVVDRDRR